MGLSGEQVERTIGVETDITGKEHSIIYRKNNKKLMKKKTKLTREDAIFKSLHFQEA